MIGETTEGQLCEGRCWKMLSLVPNEDVDLGTQMRDFDEVAKFAPVGWILGYHSALTQPLQLGRGGEPTPLTCAYIYHSVDLLYSAIESSFSTDSSRRV
jgi:hypothetical protein